MVCICEDEAAGAAGGGGGGGRAPEPAGGAGWEKSRICSWAAGSLSWSMEGGMQTSLSLVHAEQGQMLVVAESHLILRLRQPLQALITAKCQSLCLVLFDVCMSVGVGSGSSSSSRRGGSLPLSRLCRLCSSTKT